MKTEGKTREQLARELDDALERIARLEKRETEVWESEKKYRTLVEGSIQGVVIAKADPVRLVFANTAMKELAGFEVDELISMAPPQLAALIHESDRPRFFENFQKRLAGMDVPSRDEYRLVKKDGAEVWVHSLSNRIKYRGEVATLTAFVDISERRRVEEALRESEERFRFLTENMADIVWVLNLDLTVRYISPSVEKVLGFTPEERMRQPVEATMTAPSLNNLTELLREETIRDREEGVDPDRYVIVEGEYYHADGHTVWLENSAKAMRNADGEMVAIYGSSRDITDRKRAQEEKARLEEQLAQAQKMEAIGRLAGGVAHDFNNVLCSITGNAELALMELTSSDPTEQLVSDIAAAARQASEMTRQLLAFSRKQVIEPRVIDLGRMIEELQPMLARLIGEDIVLGTSIDQEGGRVRVDPGQIEQIVLNLAVNARDAMPDGGELLIETRAIALEDDLGEGRTEKKQIPYVVLTVSDTGCGMIGEVREKIFEPFFTTKEQGRGTGLGLSTVFGIVQQNSGRIEVESKPGKGSSFKLYFPRVFENEDKPVRRAGGGLRGGEETILVVEDEEMVRLMAVKILKRLGYEVLSAESGEVALDIARRHEGRIDLLLTDVVMPRMNGRELAIKLAEILPETKAIYTSRYTQDVIAHHGVLEEGVRFIAKPYSIDTLSAKVREVLDQPDVKRALS